MLGGMDVTECDFEAPVVVSMLFEQTLDSIEPTPLRMWSVSVTWL
jgi:hypothetical protein